MSRMIRLVPVALVLALGGRATVAMAQDAAPAPQAQAPDSNEAFVGDWDFTVQNRDSTISGVWRINYASGRVSGIVARPGVPPAPIRSFTMRGTRDFVLSVDFNGEAWTFQGRLDNARNVSGTMSSRGNIGRLRAQKRAG